MLEQFQQRNLDLKRILDRSRDSIKERVKEYYIFYLTLITGVFGVFLSPDGRRSVRGGN